MAVAPAFVKTFCSIKKCPISHGAEGHAGLAVPLSVVCFGRRVLHFTGCDTRLYFFPYDVAEQKRIAFSAIDTLSFPNTKCLSNFVFKFKISEESKFPSSTSEGGAYLFYED